MTRARAVAVLPVVGAVWFATIAAAAPAPAGNVTPVLDAANGAVAVVASSAPVDGRVAVVVQNGKAQPVRGVRVTAVATRPDGGLVTRGAAHALVPSTLAPGAVALGIVDFSPHEVAPDSTITFSVKSRRAASAASATALATSNFRLSAPQTGKVAQTLRMTLTNPGSRTVGGPVDVVVVCFNEASRPAVATDAQLPAAPIRPGRRRDATVKLQLLCPTYLAAAQGASVG
jgi:hypothetical protein